MLWRGITYRYLFLKVTKIVFINVIVKTETCVDLETFTGLLLFSRSVVSDSAIPWTMPGLPVHHHHPELAQQTHAHWVTDTMQPSCSLSSSSPPSFSLSRHQGLFQSVGSWHQFSSVTLCVRLFVTTWTAACRLPCPSPTHFSSGGWSIGTLASASVLPMNIQDWFPLGWTCLNSLLSKGCRESSPTPQFKCISSLAFYLLYGPTLTWLLRKS